ncbi:MAG: hypothetical protein GWN13_11625 [Phycisphaerae bacterium]|nr:hypothetical protein [Phycisphaerae bacterium]
MIGSKSFYMLISLLAVSFWELTACLSLEKTIAPTPPHTISHPTSAPDSETSLIPESTLMTKTIIVSPTVAFQPVPGGLVVGELVDQSQGQLIVQDAEGAHLIIIDNHTESFLALGAPTYDLVPEPMTGQSIASLLHLGDKLYVQGTPTSEGSLRAARIDVNLFIKIEATIVEVGPRYVKAQIHTGPRELEGQVIQIWLASSATIKQLTSGQVTPAGHADLQVGQSIMLDAYLVQDNILVAIDLKLLR